MSERKIVVAISNENEGQHLIEGTNTELASSEKIKKYHGDTYTTNMLSNIPSNYEYSSRTSNYTGTATDNVTVTYYYKLKKGTLTVNHLEEGTNKVLSPQEVSTLNYTSNYQTSPSTNALKTHEVSKTPNNATGTITNLNLLNVKSPKEPNNTKKIKTRTGCLSVCLESPIPILPIL